MTLFPDVIAQTIGGIIQDEVASHEAGVSTGTASDVVKKSNGLIERRVSAGINRALLEGADSAVTSKYDLLLAQGYSPEAAYAVAINFSKSVDEILAFDAASTADPSLNSDAPWRSIHDAKGVDGRWSTFDANGNRFTAKGQYNFVTLDGEIRVSPLRNGHYSISGGADAVDYAGSVQFGRGTTRGQLVRFSNDSGHYTPDPSASWQSGLPVGSFSPWKK